MDKNIFDEIEEQSSVPTEEQATHIVEENNNSNELPKTDEINMDDLSGTAVGQMKKYERESLDGQTVKIYSAKLFNPDTENDDIISALSNPDTKYYKTKFILTYDIENKDGLKHREYISGGIQFLQKDGSISAPSLWYEGANSQSANLWEKVAKYKNIEPKDLSPREFMNFLNSGPKAIIEEVDVEFRKKFTKKNLVKEFV